MALAAVGLQTQIWNNNLKSVLLLILFPILLLWMVWAFFALTAFTTQYATTHNTQTMRYSYSYQRSFVDPVLPEFAKLSPVDAGFYGMKHFGHYALIVATVWVMFSFLFHQWIIEKSTGAHPISRKQHPKLYNMLENLCISRGIPMPRLCVIDQSALNAFASGISEKSYTITVTLGLLDKLDDPEIETVLGHELTHIRNQDVRLLIISVVFVGMISFFCNIVYEMAKSTLRSRHRAIRNKDDGKGAAMIFLIALVVLVIGYMFSQLTRFALSRRREFLADAGAVELTKNPDGLISALQKISGKSDVEGVSSEVKQMFIDNPPALLGLFDTHPPMSKRIAALVQMGGNNSNHAQEGPWNL